MDASHCCIICKKPFGEENTVELRQKGCDGINRASLLRKDDVIAFPGQKVHISCRRLYINSIKIKQVSKNESLNKTVNVIPATRRSTVKSFNFKEECLFCGAVVVFPEERRKGHEWYSVTTLEFKEALSKLCESRNDPWSEQVSHRIGSVVDLPSAEAIYHQKCSVNFRTRRNMPTQFCTNEQSRKRKYPGRPNNDDRMKAFLKAVQYLIDNDDEQIVLSDLQDVMQKELEDSVYDAYSAVFMKKKLKEHFGEEICITEINGVNRVVTLKRNADAILQQFHSSQSKDLFTEKNEIIKAAARFILSDIKSVSTCATSYPGSAEIKSIETCLNFLPESLSLFLEEIILRKKPEAAKLKVASLGQAIMQAARPRVLLAPLQIGIAVQLHHHFASRFLIDSLHAHGFCCGYKELQRFNENASIHEGTDIPGYSGQFVQYVADNVDHNIRTLDGNDTFHGMGIIATITPATEYNLVVPRKNVSSKMISNAYTIPVVFPSPRLEKETLKYRKIVVEQASNPTASVDTFWKASLLFNKKQSFWSGFMQTFLSGEHPGKSSVMFLPMLDLKSTDPTCIYSTMKFIANHSFKHNVTPILTFDQPLWWKAMNIIASEPPSSDLHELILRLGGFHAEMSFLGTISHLMRGAGLKELFEQLFSANTVTHILSGKAISRGLRAHFILDAALHLLMFIHMFDLRLDTSFMPDVSDASQDPILLKISSLSEQVLNKTISWQDVCNDDVFCLLDEKMLAFRKSLENQRTAVLWFQYMDTVAIIQKFIKAERTGNWKLHLEALFNMLPYLAASGHNLYVKSLWFYIQAMSNLEINHPIIYRKFQEGFHVVRRSERYWAGLSTDLIIEQVLMRSLKTSGGLTRGRGMTPQQLAEWLLSMPACAEMNSSLLGLTGVSFSTGEQNKEVGPSRQARDMKDMESILDILKANDPFLSDQPLKNIVSGTVADKYVNVDDALVIGRQILSGMVDQSIDDYVFKKANQVITFSTSPVIAVDGETVTVDPQLLFQRLIFVSKSLSNIESVFKFELCSYPPSLFDECLMLRQPKKPVLADALWKEAALESVEPPLDVKYVLDGGALLHRIPWKKGSSFDEILRCYVCYVHKHYNNATIVFDGYGAASAKCVTQQRRAKGKYCADILITKDTCLVVPKDVFLSNWRNKQLFITLLGQQLQASGCKVHHASGDADVLITLTAVESAASGDTVLVADDTDIIVLLCHYANPDSFKLFLRPEPKKESKKHRVWDINAIKKNDDNAICENLLFMHAILGCDTTSHLFGIGKGKVLKLFKSNPTFRECAKSFNDSNSSAENIIQAGEKSLLCLYAGTSSDKLDHLRYNVYCQKVASSKTQVHPQILPPTSAAASQHSLRVFYQIEVWKGHKDSIKPEDWGWAISEGNLSPVLTTLPPAPEELLRTIRCNCTTGCVSGRCSCRKNNLVCSMACGNCKGSACENSMSLDEDDIVDD